MNFKIFLVLASLVILPKFALGDCMSWTAGKYKASEMDTEAMDGAVSQAFDIKNSKGAQVSFDNCIFKVRPSFDGKLQTFDYSKDEKKCNSVKVIFEMNLIGCEQTSTSSSTKKQTDSTK